MTFQKVIFQMFPVGLLNSIHRALEPHNDQGKGFHFRWKHSCWWHTIGDQFQLLARICHQCLSPKSVTNKMKKPYLRSGLYSKSTTKTENIEKQTLHGKIFDINWSFLLKINAEDLSVTVSPKSRHRHYVIEILSESLKWVEEYFTVKDCIYLSASWIFSYRTHREFEYVISFQR